MFGSLIKDPRLGRRKARPRPRRVAIVTPDITGPILNGGVGTAYQYLAQSLADDGHDVTILFVNPFQQNHHKFHRWQKHYLKRGIRLISLPEPEIALEGMSSQRLSYGTYEYLRTKDFELIHFPDMLGLGFYSFQAKRLGLAFARTELITILHGPSVWHREQNLQPLFEPSELQQAYLERLSVEYADTLVAPTQYALDWAQGKGWKLPRRTFVEQNLFSSSPEERYRGPRVGAREIVFFGRIETRKGIEVFCDAVEKLPASLRKGRQITFMGIEGVVQKQPGLRYLQERIQGWKWDVNLIFDHGQPEALRYLRSGSTLAVLPSRAETLGYGVMECVGSEIPFIASRIPAYEEVIDPRDQAAVLFDLNAEALARKLEAALTDGVPAVRFRKSPSETLAHRSQWHARVQSAPRRIPAQRGAPSITVCVAHRDRPEYLRECLASLERQSDRGFSVIVVDDGSSSQASLAALKELRKKYPRWKFVRNQVSEGPSAARNRAARLARTESLLFMDDDNLAKPGEIATFKRLARQSGAELITCAFDRFYDHDAEGNPRAASRWFPVGANLATGPFFNGFGDMNSLIDRRAFLKLGGLREVPGAGGEDAEFFMRALIAGYRMEMTPESLFWYRDHPSNLSKRTDRLATSQLLIRPFQEAALGGRIPEYFEMVQGWYALLDANRGLDHRLRVAPLVPPGRTDLFRRRRGFGPPLFQTDCPRKLGRLVKKTGVRLEKKPDHLRIRTLGTDTELTLRDLDFRGSRRVIVEMDLFSTGPARVNTSLVAHGQVLAGPSQTLRIGRNRVLVLLSGIPPEFRKNGQIHLKTQGETGAQYAIRKIEVHRES